MASSCWPSGEDSLAWARLSERDAGRPKGSRADPVIMKLVLLSHRVEGSVVDQPGKPVVGAEVVASGFSEPGRDGVYVPFLDQQVPIPRAVTDQAGQFIIHLPAGTGYRPGGAASPVLRPRDRGL